MIELSNVATPPKSIEEKIAEIHRTMAYSPSMDAAIELAKEFSKLDLTPLANAYKEVERRIKDVFYPTIILDSEHVSLRGQSKGDIIDDISFFPLEMMPDVAQEKLKLLSNAETYIDQFGNTRTKDTTLSTNLAPAEPHKNRKQRLKERAERRKRVKKWMDDKR